MESTKNLYPEAFEKDEYSVKEILDKTSINRKTFDRYKNRFSKIYLENSRREKPNNKMFFNSFIYIICLEIAKKQKAGLKHKEIENYLSQKVLSEKKGKAEELKRENETKNTGKVFIKEEKEEKESVKNEIEKRAKVPLSDFLEIKDKLHKKEVELATKNGDIKFLQEKINGMKIHIGLLETPKHKEKVKEIEKSNILKNIGSLTFGFIILIFILYKLNLINISNIYLNF